MIKKVFIILFSLICITSCQVKKVSHFDTSNSKDALAINHKAPEFEYEDINSNDKINNENLKGKTTILAFYKNNCENCDEEFEALKNIEDEYDVNLIFINTLDEKHDFEESIKQYDLSKEKLIQDPYAKLAGKFLVQAVPKVVFLDKEGLYKGALEEYKPYDEIKEIVKRVEDYKK